MWSYGQPAPAEERKKMRNPEREPVDEDAYREALREAREAREALERVHRETNPR